MKNLLCVVLKQGYQHCELTRFCVLPALARNRFLNQVRYLFDLLTGCRKDPQRTKKFPESGSWNRQSQPADGLPG
jgi:hypothetical protein